MKAVILSSALDTNGQNARYAKASERWGTDEGVLKALAIGHYDPASVVGRFAAAAEKYGELRIRSVHRATHIYQQMPADILWTHRNRREVAELAAEADIIHLNNSWNPIRQLGLKRDKAFLLHHHGSLFRTGPKPLLQMARNIRAVQAVSTVDLMQVAPEILHWAPTAYDVDWLQAFGAEHRDDHGETIRIVQCPTDSKESNYKSQPALEAAVAALQSQGADIELVVVRGKPWAEAMAIKATADIYFDQVKLGYGCNAVEAWGMGIPVIAGANDWTLNRMRQMYGELPFYTATEETIGEAITALLDKRTRTAYAQRGMAHVRKYHDELPALTRLAELYSLALQYAEEGGPAVYEMPPTTFRAVVPQVRAAGRLVTFSKGEFTTTNHHIALALRLMAKRYPRYGIEEVDEASTTLDLQRGEAKASGPAA